MTLNELLTWTAPFCGFVAFVVALSAWGVAASRLRKNKAPLLASAVEAARQAAAVDGPIASASGYSQDGSDEIGSLASTPGSMLGPRLTLIQSGGLSQRDQVTAGPAWTASDSWLTTITGIFGIGSGVLISLAPTGGFAKDALLFTIYAITAALAPVIYGALAISSPDSGQVTGTVMGYLAAAAFTVFGGLGEIATICLLGMQANTANQVRVPIWIVGTMLAVAVLIYSIRSMINVLVTETHAPEPSGAPSAAVVDAARKAVSGSAPVPWSGSLLVGYSSRRSATL
jgi:hypothetical protein